ncbi:hypothetical protein BB561_001793 [Smittium simulii]|uniref:Protein kinase domain-containing protein n=1 Tax=Smittium simulii TaxID=133385 RepID=A0A2T9YT85_9FUNG|nr:hypothetical protein BB561_001793 [Smittium simulii]
MKSTASLNFISPTATLCNPVASDKFTNYTLQSVKNIFTKAAITKKDYNHKTSFKTCAKTIVQEKIIRYTQEKQSNRSKCLLEIKYPGYVVQTFGNPVKLVGSGTDGYVNLHIDTFGNKYAIKSFFCPQNKSVASFPDYEMLSPEIRISAYFNHPNIIKVHRMIFETNGYIYIVMEYCDRDLFTLISDLHTNNSVKLATINHLFYQLIQAIFYLHNQAFVVHRDIKLDNICISSDNNLKLIDFGCSISYDPLNPFGSYGICGSDPYIAPEVFLLSKGIYDPRCTDVWAIAIVYIAMISGRFPWEAAKVSDKNFTLFLKQKEKMLEYWIPHCPETRELISAILNVDPSKRPNIKQVKSFKFYTDLHALFSNN